MNEQASLWPSSADPPVFFISDFPVDGREFRVGLQAGASSRGSRRSLLRVNTQRARFRKPAAKLSAWHVDPTRIEQVDEVRCVRPRSTLRRQCPKGTSALWRIPEERRRPDGIASRDTTSERRPVSGSLPSWQHKFFAIVEPRLTSRVAHENVL
jgi:hypothetical protein